jgi:hypothetical protein
MYKDMQKYYHTGLVLGLIAVALISIAFRCWSLKKENWKKCTPPTFQKPTFQKSWAKPFQKICFLSSLAPPFLNVDKN